MPTGYACKVQDGTITTLRDFALTCARAFGACVTMRDDAPGAEIPDAFEPSSHYDERIAELTAELEAHLAMTPNGLAVAAAADYEGECAAWSARRTRREGDRVRYEGMLAQVEAWQPPTPDHVELRGFMLQQLRESIRFDCCGDYDKAPERMTPEAWAAKREAELRRQLGYYQTERTNEHERVAGRNRWLKALRESL